MTKPIDEPVFYSDGSLWGKSGGQLEYVNQRLEWRKGSDRHFPVMVLRFTDHDVQAYADPENGLIEGVYYEIVVPLAMY